MNRSLEDIIKAEEEFSRYHDKLRNELNIVNWHFTVLKYIRENQNNYLRELNQSPAFWGLTINAHLFSALTRLNNFFGKKEKEKHLHMYSFLDFVKNNLYIFSKETFERRLRIVNRYDELAANHNCETTKEKVDTDVQKLSNLPISNLKAWRNKILSHIDKDSIAQNVDITKQYPVKIKQIDEIINTLHDMLNEYLLAFDFSTHSKDLTLEYGIQYILDALRFKLQSKPFRPTP
jgi:hypothetical protein